MNKNIVTTVLKAIAVASGVAVLTLNIIGSLTTDTAVALLGVGLTALAIASLQK